MVLRKVRSGTGGDQGHAPMQHAWDDSLHARSTGTYAGETIMCVHLKHNHPKYLPEENRSITDQAILASRYLFNKLTYWSRDKNVLL